MTTVLVFAAIALVAWFNQAPPPPPPPAPLAVVRPAQPDRVVLLPNADGSTGAVVVRSKAGEQLVDRAYVSAEVGADGVIATRAEDPAAVRARYRDSLEAQPMPPVSFVVNFRSGSNELTPESQPVLERLRAEIARRPVPELVVIGHTDRVGRVEANDELSLRRAEAVKAMLVRSGIQAAQIETAGRGEREPLMPTADEVAEPLNRRVEINVR